MSDDRISVRDKYERDDEGKTKGNKEQKVKKEKKKWFGRKKDNGNKGGGGGTDILVGIAVILVIFFLVKGTDIFKWRTWDSTISENFSLIENSLEKASHKNKSGEYEDDFYDEKRIYNDNLVRDQVDKEYVVYMYTTDEDKNKPFNDWVKKNDDVVIYKLHEGDVDTDKELREYKEKGQPMFVLYNEVERGKKEVDGVIKDSDLFDKIPERIDEIIQEKEEQKEKEKQERIEKRKKEREQED